MTTETLPTETLPTETLPTETVPAETVPGATTTAWPVLPASERRVLGVLVEKAKTTPDIYPLSLNALTTGCNQKSNRNPVLNLSEEETGSALREVQKHGLVTLIQGGRVERWKHNLYEVWNVNKVELAVLAELLLRGPQTEGELRGRAGRMEPIADLETLRGVLRPMRERGLIVFLGDEGRRGTLIAHGFHPPDELERLRSHPRPESYFAPEAASAAAPAPATSHDFADIRSEMASLREQLAQLQQAVAALTEQMRTLSG